MSDAKTLGERIDALETRLTFQDETVETLNRTITEQWRKIDALTRQVAQAPAGGRDPSTRRRQRPAAALLKPLWQFQSLGACPWPSP
jgi:hypothetical protein